MDGEAVRLSLHNEDFIRRSIKRQSRRVMRGAAMVDDEFIPTVGEIEEGIRASLANPSSLHQQVDILPEQEVPQTRWEGFKSDIHNPKWRILIFICMLTFGKHYVYDFPSAFGMGKMNTIEQRFAEHGKEYNQKMNQALYSVYSYPNTILALLGGILIDRVFGLRKSVILFTFLITSGSLVFWLGVQLVEYPVMMAGNLLMGLGGESMTVAKTTFIARWFAGGRGMSFACSMTIALTRVAASINFAVSPLVAKTDFGIAGACLVGVGVCALTTLTTILLVVCDIYFEKKGYVKVQQMGKGTESICKRLVTMVKQMAHLPLQFWLICGVCVCTYGADYPFIGYAKNFFEQKWGFSSEKAGLCLSIYHISSAAFSPFGGAIVDRVGRHSFFMVGCGLAFATMHVLMTTTFLSPYAVVILMGFIFSLLVPSLWPTIPCVVEPSLVAVGFGIMMSVQNIGMATIPLIVGTVLDAHPTSTTSAPLNTTLLSSSVATTSSTEGYELVEWIMMGVGIGGAVFGIILIAVDRRRTRMLTVSPAERIARLNEMDDERDRQEQIAEEKNAAEAGLTTDVIREINDQWEGEHVRSKQRLSATNEHRPLLDAS